MQVELYCSRCRCLVVGAPNDAADEIVDRMSKEAPALALAEGETFEDLIFAALTKRGQTRCPECGEPVSVSEESLGRMALEVLSQY
jgi:hypothetical protein